MDYNKRSDTIKEEDYVLGSNIEDRETEIAIAGRNTLFWDEYSRFWQPAMLKGRECWDYVVGDYFSQTELDDYALKEKIVLKIPGLINKVGALESMQLTGRRNGVVVSVGAEDAPDTEAINYVLQAIQRENNVATEKTMTFLDAIVTGYPSFMWFEKDYNWDKGKHLLAYHEHWDAVMPDPYFSRSDLQDCRRIIRIRLASKEEMQIFYPKRAEVIEREIHEGTHPRDYFAQQTFSSAERDSLFAQINSAQDSFNQTGKMYIIESTFFVYVPVPVWWDTQTGDYLMLPPEWDAAAIKEWKAANPQMKQTVRDVRLLWTTASAQSGLLLENNRHWFQKNEFPCEMFIPKMWNNKPYGVIEFLRGTTKGEAVADIEHLHSLRMVNDDLTILQENSIINAQDLTREKGRTGGVVVVRDGVPVGEAISFPLAGKRENVGWNEFSDKMRNNTDRLSTNPNFEGRAETSQESGKAIDRRNKQTQNKFAGDLNSYHDFDLRVTRKELLMIPSIYTANKIFRHINAKNEQVTTEVNRVTERDLMSGVPTRIMNNLAGAKYDYIPAVTDDSLNAREFELSQFIEILQNVLPQMPDASFWPFLLDSVGNRYATEFASKIREKVEAEANQPEPPQPMKKTLSINSEDLLHNPLVQEILANEGIIRGPMPQQQQSQVSPEGDMMPPAPAGQPQPQPQPIGG
jgi:hypothetical protein